MSTGQLIELISKGGWIGYVALFFAIILTGFQGKWVFKGVVTRIEETCKERLDELREDRTGWRTLAERSAEANREQATQIAQLSGIVETLTEVVSTKKSG